MGRLKTRSMVLLLTVVLVSLGNTAAQSAAEPHFKTELSGNEEVPPVPTKARGEAKFDVVKGRDELSYSIVIEGIENVTAAHIHKGKKGENGPFVVDLFREPRKEAVTGTLLAEGTISAYELIGPLKGKSIEALIEMIEAGDAYVNVHTKDYPEGEIRGQIR